MDLPKRARLNATSAFEKRLYRPDDIMADLIALEDDFPTWTHRSTRVPQFVGRLRALAGTTAGRIMDRTRFRSGGRGGVVVWAEVANSTTAPHADATRRAVTRM
jgi:hypothetical protein